MRKKWQRQRPLMENIANHPQAQELDAISQIIDSNPTICNLVLQDLCTNLKTAKISGAEGMSAD